MRKLLILMLVFGMASLANATVIDVVTVGVGDLGNAGTEADPLEFSEIIEIAIVLNINEYWLGTTSYPSYDGYTLDAMDLDLHVTGPGSLDVPGLYGAKSPYPRIGDDLRHHEDWDVWSQSGANDGTPGGYEPLIVGNSIEKMTGGSFGYILGKGGPTQLVWNLLIHCDGDGPVNIDLTLRGGTHGWEYSTPGGLPYGDEFFLTEGDLGNLTIYNVPEPATIALLGLGSLFLMRRRRK